MNKAIIQGRLGAKPETKQHGEHTICKFSVATTEKYKDKETTQWHNCTAFGKTAENIAKYFDKGQLILVEGSIAYNEHEGKRYTSIMVKNFHFCGSSGNSEASKKVDYGVVAQPKSEYVAPPQPQTDDDDLLF